MLRSLSSNTLQTSSFRRANTNKPKPLCKIKFSFPPQHGQQTDIMHCIDVEVGATVQSLSNNLASALGVDYDESIEKVILQNLCNILIENKNIKENSQKDWEYQVLKIIETSKLVVKQISDQNQTHQLDAVVNSQTQQLKRLPFQELIGITNSTVNNQTTKDRKDQRYMEQQGDQISYFKDCKSTYGKQLQQREQLRDIELLGNKSGLKQHRSDHNRQFSLYERAMLQKKEKQEKILKIKEKDENKQLQECTFTPKTNNPKPASFFNQNQNHVLTHEDDHSTDQNQKTSYCVRKHQSKRNLESRFEKLYRDAFDIQNKRKNQLKKKQTDEESKLAELTFIPEINECSKEIWRVKSHSILLLSNIPHKEEDIRKQPIENRHIHVKPVKQFVVDKKSEEKNRWSFTPTISAKSRQIASNFPTFQERLERQLKAIKSSKEKMQKKNCRFAFKSHGFSKNNNKPITLKIKKQTYIIDDSDEEKEFEQSEEIKSQRVSDQTRKNTASKTNKMAISQTTQKKISAISPSTLRCCQDENKNLQIDFTPKYQKFIKNQEIGKAIEKQSKKIPYKYQKVEEQRRSQIFHYIYHFFTSNPPLSTCNFRKNSKLQSQFLSMSVILSNPYIPQSIFLILQPFLQELEAASEEWEQEVEFTEEQFIWAISKLYQGLSTSQKGILLAWGIKLLPESKG